MYAIVDDVKYNFGNKIIIHQQTKNLFGFYKNKKRIFFENFHKKSKIFESKIFFERFVKNFCKNWTIKCSFVFFLFAKKIILGKKKLRKKVWLVRQVRENMSSTTNQKNFFFWNVPRKNSKHWNKMFQKDSNSTMHKIFL